ncbi:HAD-IC family P-type ATPase [Clostridium intestinale]|uniref:ATPase, P-type (Transporting), HAD superfamily, subfamily IC n=1 Tax=Clostridium intestinale DSM 6191 TaxID=1121320 RepID=A0A1M5XMB8_9CLOT|nr:HAD-IC family P-type ATPase [Clostridium intestinale]SHI00896.1 ATPase, P-type (transporting), HAD superfamily, subfamily IC [Clostridium intestinale DSM 6191]
MNDLRNIVGLTNEQVEIQKRSGLSNTAVKPLSKTKLQIIISNVFTYFNLVFAIITILLISVKSYRDLTFLPIIIANILIGIIQELRAKKVLDKLTMINTPCSLAIRNGKRVKIPVHELVKDDIVIFKAGNQISADCIIIKGDVTVNEALLTGEADEVHKYEGDTLMSGSFVVSGQCYARLEKVGEESYISQLTLEAKASKKEEQSKIIRSLNKIVKIVGIIIIPIGITLFYQQYIVQGESAKISIQAMVAAIIGMIPEGLFLLASVTLAISAMKLAKGKVLLHDMKSIETLARVDTLCVDKTGTITDGTMKVIDMYLLNKKMI